MAIAKPAIFIESSFTCGSEVTKRAKQPQTLRLSMKLSSCNWRKVNRNTYEKLMHNVLYRPSHASDKIANGKGDKNEKNAKALDMLVAVA